jgi:hypothetical protein
VSYDVTVIDNVAAVKFTLLSTFFMLETRVLWKPTMNYELWFMAKIHIMSEGTLRQSCRMFKDGHTNVHNEEQSGQPSVVSDDLVQSAGQKNCERQFQNFCVNFHKIHALLSIRFSQLS